MFEESLRCFREEDRERERKTMKKNKKRKTNSEGVKKENNNKGEASRWKLTKYNNSQMDSDFYKLRSKKKDNNNNLPE